jgi:hypothetical protein
MTSHPSGRRCHVLHDESGRILALAGTEERAGRVRFSSRPVPGPGQHAIEIELGTEHDGLDLHDILANFVVERREPGTPMLRRRVAAC